MSGRRQPSLENIDMLVSEYMSGKSLREIADVTGINWQTVRYNLRKEGIAIRTKNEAATLGGPKSGEKRLGIKRGPMRAETRKAMSIAKTGKGKGFTLKPSGYIELTMGPHKYRGLHDVIMEAILGTPLLPDQVVHHIDENRQNNHPSNLQVMTRREHTRLHQIKNPSKRKLSNEQVAWIRSLSDSFSRKQVAKELGVNPDSLWRIRTRRSYKTLT
jgi:hypothetical protein